MKEDQDDSNLRDVLLEVNAQMKGIASLDKIIVRVCNGSLVPSVREAVQGIDWIVIGCYR